MATSKGLVVRPQRTYTNIGKEVLVTDNKENKEHEHIFQERPPLGEERSHSIIFEHEGSHSATHKACKLSPEKNTRRLYLRA